MDIPIFTGEDAMGWTGKVEKYFRLRGVQEEEKMEVVMVAMEGNALSWFQWWETCNPNQSWFGFKNALIQSFQPVLTGDPFELLLANRDLQVVDHSRHLVKLLFLEVLI